MLGRANGDDIPRPPLRYDTRNEEDDQKVSLEVAPRSPSLYNSSSDPFPAPPLLQCRRDPIDIIPGRSSSESNGQHRKHGVLTVETVVTTFEHARDVKNKNAVVEIESIPFAMGNRVFNFQ